MKKIIFKSFSGSLMMLMVFFANAATSDFVVREPCKKPVSASSGTPSEVGEQFARGMMDCMKDSSTDAGASNVSPGYSEKPPQMDMYSIDVLPKDKGLDKYNYCKAEQKINYVGISSIAEQRNCDAVIFSYESYGQTNPFTLSASDSVFVKERQVKADSGSIAAEFGVKMTQSCQPAQVTSGTKMQNDFCESHITRDQRFCDASRIVEVTRQSVYSCLDIASVNEIRVCNRLMSCVAETGNCASSGFIPGSVAGDMAVAVGVTGSGESTLAFGSATDNNFPEDHGGHERVLNFDVFGLDRVTKFELTDISFDDYIKVTLNGNLVYNGPMGGTDLYSYQGEKDVAVQSFFIGGDGLYYEGYLAATNCDEFGVCTTSPEVVLSGPYIYCFSFDTYGICNNFGAQGVYWGNGGPGDYELGSNWQASPKINMIPFLVEGKNELKTKLIVGGRGELRILMTSSQRCKPTCSFQDTPECTSLANRVPA